jgi:dTDP-4-dehydrorhamnose 3,5-epimerase
VRIVQTVLSGTCIIDGDRQEDVRGYFVRTFCRDTFRDAGLVHDFPQWSASFNRQRGTIRGLHFQKPPRAETKLVRVTRGAIFDVVLDIRPNASTYGQWISIELSAENGRHVYIPEGFAHGFQTLLDDTEVEYAISAPYAPGFGEGYRYNDPAFGISWPLPVSAISEKDASWPDFQDR